MRQTPTSEKLSPQAAARIDKDAAKAAFYLMKTLPKNYNPAVTAHHEAGHILATLALGGRIFSARMRTVSEESAAWTMGIYQGAFLSSPENPDITERAMVAACGGPVAEIEVFQFSDWPSQQEALWHDLGDFGSHRADLEKLSPGSPQEALERCLERARELLANRRAEMEAVAKALLARRILGEEEILQTVAGASAA